MDTYPMARGPRDEEKQPEASHNYRPVSRLASFIPLDVGTLAGMGRLSQGKL